MKKKYESPQLEMIKFYVVDVISTSGEIEFPNGSSDGTIRDWEWQGITVR